MSGRAITFAAIPLLVIALIVAVSLSHARPRPAPRRPNVLLIAVDDLNTRLGCYGSDVQSPHIDALARRSVRFDRAYCQYPLGHPSQLSLLTSRRPDRTRIIDNNQPFRLEMTEVVTLPNQFRGNGYVTAWVGQIFHGGPDVDKGWSEGGAPAEPPAARPPEQPTERQASADRWAALPGDGEDQPDYRTASRAVALLEKHKDVPFFLAIGFAKPHAPLLAPKQYFDLYDPARMKLPPDFAPAPVNGSASIPRPALRPNFDLFIQRDAPEPLAREAIAAYYAAVSFMDAQVGRVLDALDRLDLSDNTIIVFCGDHGCHLGEKGMWSAMSLFEVATRVPLLIAAPSARGAGKGCPRTVELLDLYPTLTDLCGLAPSEEPQGQSLVPLLADSNAAWVRAAYTMIQRGPILGKSVRTERYRYTEWGEGRQGVELYDHETDPAEQHNLARDAAQVDTVPELERLLRAAH